MGSRQLKYLIVEDDKDFAASLESEFRTSRDNVEVVKAHNEEEAEFQLKEAQEKEEPFDLVILDMNLTNAASKNVENAEGLRVLNVIGETSNSKVVFLTSSTNPNLHIRAIDLGGFDAYLDKEHYNEKAHIRQACEAVLNAGPRRPARFFRFGDGWKLDTDMQRLANPAGAVVALSDREFSLLRAFVQNPQEVQSEQELVERIGAASNGNQHAAFTQLLSRLRKKLGKNNRFIDNVYGKGFRFVPEVVAETRE